MSDSLGPRLKSARESLGKSQEDVARDLAISREMISYWESGARSPSTAYLSRLCDYYGLNISVPGSNARRSYCLRSKDLTDLSELSTMRGGCCPITGR